MNKEQARIQAEQRFGEEEQRESRIGREKAVLLCFFFKKI